MRDCIRCTGAASVTSKGLCLSYWACFRPRSVAARRPPTRIWRRLCQVDCGSVESLGRGNATPVSPWGMKTRRDTIARARRNPMRRRLPEHLSRVECMIHLPAAVAAMGKDGRFIGYDSAEQSAVIPCQCCVIVTKRDKYAPVHADVPRARSACASPGARRKSAPSRSPTARFVASCPGGQGLRLLAIRACGGALGGRFLGRCVRRRVLTVVPFGRISGG
jgi:hypothetical protein